MDTNINYVFRSIGEISTFLEIWEMEIIIIFILNSLLLFIVLYFLPYIKILLISKSFNKEKENKKNLLKQILIQKEIETEIEKEINEENK